MNENQFRGALSGAVTELQPPPSMQVGPVLAAGRRARRRRRGVVICAAFVGVAMVASAATLGMNDAPRGGHPASTPGSSSLKTASSSTTGKPIGGNSLLLLDEPGWKVTDVYKFTGEEGTIFFGNADLTLEMEWKRPGEYDSYRGSRLQKGGNPEKMQVAGSAGELFRPSEDQSEVILQPRDGSFVVLITHGNWTRAVLDRVLGHVIRVDARTWLAAMPAEVVTPDRAQAQAATMLADVPRPPGFDTAALNSLGANDAYQFGAEVTRMVGCGWIAESRRAKQAGDETALQRAGAAMRSSHDWQVLKQLQAQGRLSQTFWETADKVAAGDQKIISGEQNPLDCK